MILDQGYIYFIGSEKLCSTCYLLFDEYSIHSEKITVLKSSKSILKIDFMLNI